MSKVAKPAIRVAFDRLSKAKLRSKAPISNETIARWGSVIHWLEIAVVLLSSKSRGHFRWVVPVTCGSCNKRRSATVYVTNPHTGYLTPDCLRAPQYDYTRFGYTGLCAPCLLRINRQNTTYPDGTVLFHLERTVDGLPVFCGACKKRGFLNCALSETLHGKHWLCPICDSILGKWLHKESGATVYWLKRKEGQRNYVEFECAKCANQFYCKDDLPSRAQWWGLCPSDRLEHNPQLITENKLLPYSDKEIQYKDRFGEGKPKRGKKSNRRGVYVLVPCPLPGCGKTDEFHFDTTRKKGFIGLCKPGKNGHTRDEIALFYMSQPQNANGHANGGTPNDVEFENLLRAVKAVFSAWTDAKARTSELRLNKVGLLEIGDALTLKLNSDDDTVNRTEVNRELKRLGVYTFFPPVKGSKRQGGTPAFVRAVAQGVGDGASPEEFTRNLFKLRERS